ncbi:MAG: ABC transporter ATP-binding protein [Hyphomicrobiaceae bacterium]
MMVLLRDVRLALGNRIVLDAVDLSIPSGRVTAVVGPNGAGKSTLLRACAGLLPAQRGAITLGGRPIAQLGRQQLARVIAYLPQERAVHWPLAAKAVVALGRLPHDDTDPEAISRALAAMDIAHLADRPIAQLSGGERARVLVARALAQEAPLLIADEPTAGLDPAHALAMFALFRSLAAAGRTIVVALHDLSLAARFADHIILVSNGRAAASGSPAEVLTPGTLEPAFGVTMLCTSVGGLPIVAPVSTLP